MVEFMDENFLLKTKSANILYHEYAKDMPVYDFHSHLNVQHIAENVQYSNLTKIWLEGDHYKWRAMRSNGVKEEYITGKSSDWNKFNAWAKTVPSTVGNPLFHWTHLELQRFFDEGKMLNETTSEKMWRRANEKLQTEELQPRGIIKQSNVDTIYTTDDPLSDLKHHDKIKEDETIDFKVKPTFRPDKIFAINDLDYLEYIDKLILIMEQPIVNYEELLNGLRKRIDYFDEIGCAISDHSFEYLPMVATNFDTASAIFSKRIKGIFISENEADKFKLYTLLFLGKEYKKRNWVMQLHLGALRNNNRKMHKLLGSDTGFDSMGDARMAKPLNMFLNNLDEDNNLPKTIIYNLNPMYNDVVAATIGNFHEEGIRGKVQFGSGWWFNDQKDGINKQLKTLSNLNLLSNFVGMLTDSRSFLSFSRHEYFRRVLCDLFGKWIEQGELPRDYNFIGNIIQNISYNNAKDFFE